MNPGNARLRAASMAYLTELKESTPCADCGRFFQACSMDFDHLADKSAGISDKVANGKWGMARILAEVAKCEIVCASCHRVRTRDRGQYRGAGV
jgi:hypothetical protein